MAKTPSRKQYAETLGEITIEWNYLERAINALGYYYLGGDKGVASHIFAGMGNVSRASFIAYLIDRFEDEANVSEHVLHLLKMFNILRENRNILEHSTPLQSETGDYLEFVNKPNKRGESLIFVLPFGDLKEILADMTRTSSYARRIGLASYPEDKAEANSLDGLSFRALARRTLASTEKPLLPRKIEKFLPPEGPPAC